MRGGGRGFAPRGGGGRSFGGGGRGGFGGGRGFQEGPPDQVVGGHTCAGWVRVGRGTGVYPKQQGLEAGGELLGAWGWEQGRSLGW